MVETIPMDKKRLDVLREDGYTRDSVFEDGSQEELKHRLLDIGGEAVCLRGVEEDYDKIMTRGQEWIKPNIKMMPGRPSQCHANSAKIWKKGKDVKIVTGYSLSNDGAWRQHTWCLSDNTILETTEERIVYFGFILNEEESQKFYLENT